MRSEAIGLHIVTSYWVSSDVVVLETVLKVVVGGSWVAAT